MAKKEDLVEEITEKIEELPAEEVVEELPVEKVVEEAKPAKKADKLNDLVKCRGFNSYKEAQDFAKKDSFKNLHELDQEEYLNWLNNLK